jgi:hypothetical protein
LLISSRKRSKVQGQAVGRPSSSRYQLLQPVAQIVVRAASLRSASKRSIAAREAEISSHAPDRTCSTSCMMYANCSSATSMREKFPTGPFGPLSMKKLGKSGTVIAM